MTMLQEDRKKLSKMTQDMKRAIDSLEEELQAIDWYRQRADASTDAALAKVFLHNLKEEEEHASMLLAWIAGKDKIMAKNLKSHLGRKPNDITKE
jgi:hypothetical protein